MNRETEVKEEKSGKTMRGRSIAVCLARVRGTSVLDCIQDVGTALTAATNRFAQHSPERKYLTKAVRVKRKERKRDR